MKKFVVTLFIVFGLAGAVQAGGHHGGGPVIPFMAGVVVGNSFGHHGGGVVYQQSYNNGYCQPPPMVHRQRVIYCRPPPQVVYQQRVVYQQPPPVVYPPQVIYQQAPPPPPPQVVYVQSPPPVVVQQAPPPPPQVVYQQPAVYPQPPVAYQPPPQVVMAQPEPPQVSYQAPQNVQVTQPPPPVNNSPAVTVVTVVNPMVDNGQLFDNGQAIKGVVQGNGGMATLTYNKVNEGAETKSLTLVLKDARGTVTKVCTWQVQLNVVPGTKEGATFAAE